MVRLARRAGEDAEILANGIIIVAVAALIGGRAYHVIDQWALYQNDPIKIFLPPYSGLGVYGGIVDGDRRRIPVCPLQGCPVPALGRHRGAGPVRDAGHRALGELLQPGAVRHADEAAVGHPDRLRASHRRPTRLQLRGPTRKRRASTRSSSTNRCPGWSARSSFIWLGFHARKSLRPGDLLLLFFVWYGIVRFVLETFRHDNWTFFGVPTAQIVSLLFVIPWRS